MNSLLPDFWKLTRDYVEGRLTKNKSGTNAGGAAQAVGSRRKKPAVDVLRIKKCEEMEQHLGTLFSTIISRTFFLHLRNADIRASRRMQSSLSGDRQAFSVLASNSALVSPEQSLPLPPERAATVFNSHPILFCHFLLLLATEWDRCFDRMQALSNSGQTSPFLVQAIARIHEVVLRLVEILCDNFVAETRAIHVYEDWIVVVPNGLSLLAVANPVPVGSHVQDLAARTALLDLFDQFCRYVFSSLHSIAKSTVLRQTSRPAGGEVGTLGGVAQEIKDQARRCLVDSLYFFLDGLERLSFHREVPRLEVTWGKGATGTSAPQNGSGRGDETVSEPFATSGSDGSKRHRVDSGRLDLRILVVLSNLSFFIGKLLPDLTQHLLNVIPGKLADMVQPIYRAAQVLDSMLFDNYVKRKASGLADIMRVGLLFSGLDWFLISRPQEIAAYAYDAIVSLVLIHAEVTAINPLLVHRIIGELWVDIAQTTLDSFRQVDRFSVAGMVQATLETHFLQRSLSNFETDKSRKLIQLVYSCVARGTAHEDKLLAGSNAGKVDKTTGLDALEQIVDDLELQEMLVSVRDYLAEISQTTFNMTKSLT